MGRRGTIVATTGDAAEVASSEPPAAGSARSGLRANREPRPAYADQLIDGGRAGAEPRRAAADNEGREVAGGGFTAKLCAPGRTEFGVTPPGSRSGSSRRRVFLSSATMCHRCAASQI
ncbi:hypothetical protein GCM10022236_41420 [Microlunatus ginsengisoli]|uniref:Uncharacterized protein n=1 Tax=Microlunatus ginsengisoli TaxID=363863 RepID=A0ABP7AKQ6_9ACTN